MNSLEILETSRVFHYFKKICSIPHGSNNMDKISDYCCQFAKEQGLDYKQDDARNVIIYKKGGKGCENCEPVILQSHIDMVCQKTPESNIDFNTDGLELYVDGEFLKAKNTTLGADDGIGAAMMLAILEDDELIHPPIEAVFTTDEEIGMIGAGKLDMSALSGKKMINLDGGTNNNAVISCAGGVDIKITVPIEKSVVSGKRIDFAISGLKGGHSGAMIDKGRVNANMLAGRILAYARKIEDFDLLELNGGDKGNVIPSRCDFSVVVMNSEEFITKLEDYIEKIKHEFSDREENLKVSIRVSQEDNFKALSKKSRNKIIHLLTVLPNGVMEISTKIINLVETSLNLGILKTCDETIELLFTVRSNKESALEYLQDKLFHICEYNECTVEASGLYPPWEYVEDTDLQKLYKSTFYEKFSENPVLCAVHAGLECGIFANKIKGLDCISIGPDEFDIHTVNERLNIISTEKFYDFLTHLISKCV